MPEASEEDFFGGFTLDDSDGEEVIEQSRVLTCIKDYILDPAHLRDPLGPGIISHMSAAKARALDIIMALKEKNKC